AVQGVADKQYFLEHLSQGPTIHQQMIIRPHDPPGVLIHPQQGHPHQWRRLQVKDSLTIALHPQRQTPLLVDCPPLAQTLVNGFERRVLPDKLQRRLSATPLDCGPQCRMSLYHLLPCRIEDLDPRASAQQATHLVDIHPTTLVTEGVKQNPFLGWR